MKCCLGLEPTPEAYTAHLVHVYRLVWRVLRDDATAWLNLGDSYAADRGGTYQPAETLAGGKGGRAADGSITNRGRFDGYNPTRNAKGIGLKHKDLMMIPHRVAFALQADGWFVRSAIVWAKGVSFCPTYSGTCMPESVTDRPTSAYEMVFLLAKQEKYFYDAEAVREKVAESNAQRTTTYYNTQEKYGADNGGNSGFDDLAVRMRSGDHTSRNLRNVFLINPKPFPDAHYAVFPTALVDPMIKASTSEKGCCPVCSAPWQRVVERGNDPYALPLHERPPHGATQPGNATIKPGTFGPGRPRLAEGWQPTCSCDGGDPVPCTVLDPFSGAGTTGFVALAKGRNYIGIELNPDYAEMSKRRIVSESPMFNTVDMIDHRIEQEAA